MERDPDEIVVIHVDRVLPPVRTPYSPWAGRALPQVLPGAADHEPLPSWSSGVRVERLELWPRLHDVALLVELDDRRSRPAALCLPRHCRELPAKHGPKSLDEPDVGLIVAFLAMTILTVSTLMPNDLTAQTRMPPIPEDGWTEAQRSAAAEFGEVRGALSGPWHAILRSPGMLNPARSLSDYLRFNSSLPPRLSEFVIIITAREWTSQYEWNAHHALAMRGGLSPDIAAAVAEGRRPEGMAADEAAVYDFCMELHRNRSVSDATYARALQQLGEQGIMDMIGLSGWYTLVSMILNTARVPLPENAMQRLEPFPR